MFEYLTRILSTRAATCKGGQSANKFHKSQISKFADFNYLLYLRTFRKCGIHFCRFAICGSNPFSNFRIYSLWMSPQIHTFSPYKYSIKCSNSKFYKIIFFKSTFRIVLRQSYAVFCRNLRICDCEMSLRICGFAICGRVCL
jgi:hypothetical protein